MWFSLTGKDTDTNEDSSPSEQGTGRGRRASTREIQRHRVRPIKVEESDDEEVEEGGVKILNLGENCRLPHKQTFVPTWDGMCCNCPLACPFAYFPSQFLPKDCLCFFSEEARKEDRDARIFKTLFQTQYCRTSLL